jgi:hypothetical protein
VLFYAYVIVQFGAATAQTAKGLENMIRANPEVVPQIEQMKIDSLSSFLKNRNDSSIITIKWGDSNLILIPDN